MSNGDMSVISDQFSSFAIDYEQKLQGKENLDNFINKLNERKKLISDATKQKEKKHKRKFINNI